MNQARAEALAAMLAEDPDDAFALYGLALEHKAGDELDAAIGLLRRLLAVAPDHLYGHYQLGEVLLAEGQEAEAEAVLAAGLAAARAAQDFKAAGELQALLDQCG